MIHESRDLSPEQRAAAELLLGRPLRDEESISVQAFDPAPVSEAQRREAIEGLKTLLAKVNRSVRPTTEEEAEEIFTEAMRSSRPGYRTHK